SDTHLEDAGTIGESSAFNVLESETMELEDSDIVNASEEMAIAAGMVLTSLSSITSSTDQEVNASSSLVDSGNVDSSEAVSIITGRSVSLSESRLLGSTDALALAGQGTWTDGGTISYSESRSLLVSINRSDEQALASTEE